VFGYDQMIVNLLSRFVPYGIVNNCCLIHFYAHQYDRKYSQNYLFGNDAFQHLFHQGDNLNNFEFCEFPLVENLLSHG